MKNEKKGFKQLTMVEMEETLGGNWISFFDGFCVGFTGSTIIGLASNLSPATKAIYYSIQYGCYGYGAGRVTGLI